ncbi:MAG: hypothetical protein ACFE0Q_02395 [Anaerolineae bacterium]
MKFRITYLMILVLGILIACTPDTTSTEIPTDDNGGANEADLQGSVDITYPMNSAIIYSETLFVEGTSSDIPEEGFQIQVVSAEDALIAEATVLPNDDGQWVLELVPEYEGDPVEVTIAAASPTLPDAPAYDVASVVLATLDSRPQEGAFGEITTPTDGDQVGGDTILVSGRGSGLFENGFVLVLADSDGETIVETPVTIYNPYFVDDVLWEAELPREDFIGNGTIRMDYIDAATGDVIILDEVDVTVSSAAG